MKTKQTTKTKIKTKRSWKKTIKKIAKKHPKNIQKGGEQFFVDFETVKNTGQIDHMSNQCFWISIVDFLNHYLDQTISVKQLREMAKKEGKSINCENEMFDYNDHKTSLEFIANKFNLKITIYDVDSNRKIDIIERNVTFGFENGLPVHIAFFGNHFELIKTIDGATVLPARAYVTMQNPITNDYSTNKKHNKTQKLHK